MLVEHAPDVVWVIEEVDERRPDAGAEHIAEPLARPKLIAERVAQEFLEKAIRERNPLRNPRSRRHGHALRQSRRTPKLIGPGGRENASTCQKPLRRPGSAGARSSAASSAGSR